VTTFFAPAVVKQAIRLGEQEAHHARVKRLKIGDEVTITDGNGSRGTGRIAAIEKRGLTVEVEEVSVVPRPPEINLFVPVGDKDRMLWIAEKATELQIASWNAVMYERSKSVSPRGEGGAFAEKVRARMMSAIEQSGGAWIPAVNQQMLTVGDLTRQKGIVLAQDGQPLAKSRMTAPVNLAVGPEGGFTTTELGALGDAGWSAASIGEVTLRFETAAVGAVAIVRSMLH
jgi:16S rRNA (uracil1498-N3)-methyltransferase